MAQFKFTTREQLNKLILNPMFDEMQRQTDQELENNPLIKLNS